MKEKIKEIIKDYRNEAKKIIGITKYKLIHFKKHYKEYWQSFKESLKDPQNRMKYLTVASVFVLALLLANIYTTYGYYHDTVAIPFVQAKVGNMYMDKYDYTLLVYLENPNKGVGNSDYRLVDDIPTAGYAYSGYTCNNKSDLEFDEDLLTTRTTLEQKDICSLYFDLVTDLDLTVNIMLEDNIGSDTYTVSRRIPAFGYKYDHYDCAHEGTITYDSNLHKVSLASKGKDYCSMYFKKEYADVTVKLFVENTLGEQDYISRLEIPSNINYRVNTERSSCTGKNNERIDTEITYVDGYLGFDTDEITTCSIYLDRNE